MATRQTEEKITALYERLSRDDELAGGLELHRKPKRYLTSYAEQHGYTNLVHCTDDGYSSGNFDRPAWKRLVADIEAGKVATILAKDMSRIGRNYLEIGFYTEVMFREYGVHFIAIANNIDSDDQNSSEFAPFINIMSEWYLRDCSRKITAAFQTKGRAGKPTTNAAIYGYRKDPKDKDYWLIDEEAAAVVRRIYQLAISGKGYAEIAQILRDDRIEMPAYYLAHRNGRTVNTHGGEDHRFDWYVTTIGAIIAKPEYKGHTVNFRTGHKSYKDKRTKNPEEDWLIFENTHEAIVDPETRALAQRATAAIHQTDTVGEANPLTGLLFCTDCGHRMYNHRHWNTTPKGKKYLVDSYECGTYNNERHRVEHHCCSHHISTKAVRTLILDAIRYVSQFTLADEFAFVQKVREASEVQQEVVEKLADEYGMES